MKKDNSPVRQTCPEINKASGIIASAIQKMGEIEMELLALDRGLEKLRTENSDLRTWGNECNDRANELEVNLQEAEKEITELEGEIKGLNKYIDANQSVDWK